MDEREKLIREVEQLRAFLGMADIREFTYDIEKDVLTNMRYGKECEIFYQGSLSGWEEDYKKNRMDRGGEGNVSLFCDALREGRDQFEIKFSFKGLTRVIKGVTVDDPEKGKIVYGVLMLGQGQVVREVNTGEVLYKRSSDRDPMLNMLNKKAIMDYGKRMCQNENGPVTYFVIFDLDNFKVVNDTYGHLYGDEVLVTITDIINHAVGENGLVGRIGGDEIMIVTKGISDKAQLRPMLREIRCNVEDTYKGRMGGIPLTCSMGAAAYPIHGKSHEQVMKLADKMLYLAKEKGKNRYVIFTPEMHGDLVKEKEEEQGGPRSFAPAFNKISILQYMLDDYLLRGTSSNERSFSMVGDSFKLSEILIIYDGGKTGFQWTPQGVSNGEDYFKWIELNDDFYRLFDENHLLIVDSLYALSEVSTGLEERLRKRDVQSALFYALKSAKGPEGYVLFAKKSQRQKWSEYELLALSSIAKIFEMSVYK